MSFEELGLDPRLLKSLSKRVIQTPTIVQTECIPKVLEGKDVVARARTGSGKTLAYLLPALHKILNDFNKEVRFQVLILVPTRELCEQVKQEVISIVQHCGEPISVTTLSGDLKQSAATAGNLVIATPGMAAKVLQGNYLPEGTLNKSLRLVVLDEADLMLAYEFEQDIAVVAREIPREAQVMLMSATVSDDVERLQKLVLHNPVVLNLLGTVNGRGADGEAGPLGAGLGVAAEVEHFALRCAREDRMLVTMALIRLGLVPRKVLVFVNTVDAGVRLKLFLETFGSRAALLNAELPLNSRSHILSSFNRGLFDYLIATDDVHAASRESQVPQKRKKPGKAGPGGARARKAQQDEEFGVARGIDFKGVRTVINFEPPSSVKGYVHRVGRTGRAGASGTAISLITPEDAELAEQLDAALRGERSSSEATKKAEDEEASTSAGEEEESAADKAKGLRPYTRLTAVQIDALRYRAEDVAASLTKTVVREARLRELRAEILNSTRLKEYFEGHDAEKMLLRHDKVLRTSNPAPHLKHLPGYLKDPNLITEKSNVGREKGALPYPKRRKTEKDKILKNSDPLKAVGVFVRAPKKGGDFDEEMTEMEKKAEAKGKKEAKKLAKSAGKVAFKPKVNVRKHHRRR